MIRATSLALLALSGGLQLASAVQPLAVKGPDFIIEATGERFQIVGVAYQPGGSSGYKPESGEDPLTNGDICLRDAALMQRLGVNGIRVYNVDPSLNHDECASIFNIAGIYMMIDVNSPLPNESLNREKPYETYNHDYLNRTFSVVEAFKNYPNTAMFFSGNEVINDIATSNTAPYIRAVTRDIKQYVKKHSDRYIPVGYSAADVREVLVDSWAYFTCSLTGDDTDDSIADLFALNSYSWCGEKATFDTAGYDDLVGFFNETSVPVFMSEYGCNEVKPRIFNEVQALYGEKMTPFFSGGVIYEYTQEENEYGLVQLGEDGSVQLLTDYDNFQMQLNKLDFEKLQSTASLVPEVPFKKCDKKLITNSKFPSNFTIPAPPADGLAKLISEGIKNPHNGKIIDIKDEDLIVKQKVENTDGSVLEGLAVKRLAGEESNTPSGLTGGNGTKTGDSKPSSTTAGAAETSDSAAGVVEVGRLGVLVAGLLAGLAII